MDNVKGLLNLNNQTISLNLKVSNLKRPSDLCPPKSFLDAKGILRSTFNKKTFFKSPSFSKKEHQKHTQSHNYNK